MHASAWAALSRLCVCRCLCSKAESRSKPPLARRHKLVPCRTRTVFQTRWRRLCGLLQDAHAARVWEAALEASALSLQPARRTTNAAHPMHHTQVPPSSHHGRKGSWLARCCICHGVACMRSALRSRLIAPCSVESLRWPPFRHRSGPTKPPSKEDAGRGGPSRWPRPSFALPAAAAAHLVLSPPCRRLGTRCWMPTHYVGVVIEGATRVPPKAALTWHMPAALLRCKAPQAAHTCPDRQSRLPGRIFLLDVLFACRQRRSKAVRSRARCGLVGPTVLACHKQVWVRLEGPTTQLTTRRPQELGVRL